MFAPVGSRPPPQSIISARDQSKRASLGIIDSSRVKTPRTPKDRKDALRDSLFAALEGSRRSTQKSSAPHFLSDSEFQELFVSLGCPAEVWPKFRSTPFVRYLQQGQFILELSTLDAQTAEIAFKLLARFPEYRVLRVTNSNPSLLRSSKGSSVPGSPINSHRSMPPSARNPKGRGNEKLTRYGSVSASPSYLRAQILQQLSSAIAFHSHSLLHIELSGLNSFDTEFWNSIAKSLKKCDGLKRFYLRQSNVPDEAVEPLCQSLATLQLQHLQLAGCGLTSAAARPLSRLILAQSERRDTLNWAFNLRNATFKKQKYNVLAQNGLFALDLSSNKLGDKGISIICDTLANDIWIQFVDFRGNQLTREGVQVIVQLLHDNPYLIRCHVQGAAANATSGGFTLNTALSSGSAGGSAVVEQVDPYFKRRNKKLKAILATQSDSSLEEDDKRYLMPLIALSIPESKLFQSEGTIRMVRAGASQSLDSAPSIDFSYRLKESPLNIVQFPALRRALEEEKRREEEEKAMEEEEKRLLAGKIGKTTPKRPKTAGAADKKESEEKSERSRNGRSRPSTAASSANASAATSPSQRRAASLSKSPSKSHSANLTRVNGLISLMETKLSQLQSELTEKAGTSQLMSILKENERLRLQLRETEKKQREKRMEKRDKAAIPLDINVKSNSVEATNTNPLAPVENPVELLEFVENQFGRLKYYLDVLETEFESENVALEGLERLKLAREEAQRLREEKERREEEWKRVEQKRQQVIDQANEKESREEAEAERNSKSAAMSPGRVLASDDVGSIRDQLEFAEIRRSVRKRLDEWWQQTEMQLDQ